MRSKIILVIFFSFLTIFFTKSFYSLLRENSKVEKKEKKIEEKPTPKPSKKVKEDKFGKETVFDLKEKNCAIAVYWVNFKNLAVHNFDKLLYFGIAPTLEGEIAEDQGLEKLGEFIASFPSFEKGLIVRMVDKELNSSFLKNKEGWEVFLKNIYTLAKEKGFTEVSFDIELSPFQENLKEPLAEFLKKARELNNFGIKLTFIAYADSFYRKRPFDFEKISEVVDEVYLMAYDFTKAYSEPGPNFPLEKGAWGYSLFQAVEDFSKFFEKKRITVIFGAYGYKWKLGEDGRPLSFGRALSFNSIKKNYLNVCVESGECKVEFDSTAGEKVLKGKDFVIWYDDEETFSFKKERLKKKGIESFCYFALGYY